MFFWLDLWLGDVPLSVRYQRLFDLSLNMSSTIAKMSDLRWEGGGAVCVWFRQLWVWEEEMLEKCRSVLANVVLQPNVEDQWLWRHDPSGGYTVQGAYNLLTYRGVQDAEATRELIWPKQVPLKATVLAW
jgi:hypothetical protein